MLILCLFLDGHLILISHIYINLIVKFYSQIYLILQCQLVNYCKL